MHELTTEQKLEVRELQMKIVGLQEQVRSITQAQQEGTTRLRTLIEVFAKEAGLPLDAVSFDLDTLTFTELPAKAEAATNN